MSLGRLARDRAGSKQSLTLLRRGHLFLSMQLEFFGKSMKVRVSEWLRSETQDL